MVDWTCAITPFFILQGLQMPRRRKLSVQIILGLGMFGSAAGLVRMGYYHTYDTVKYPNESLCKSSRETTHPVSFFFSPTRASPLRAGDKRMISRANLAAPLSVNWGHTILWSVLEAGLGVIACSLPPLRILFKRFYQGSSGLSGRKSGMDLRTGEVRKLPLGYINTHHRQIHLDFLFHVFWARRSSGKTPPLTNLFFIDGHTARLARAQWEAKEHSPEGRSPLEPAGRFSVHVEPTEYRQGDSDMRRDEQRGRGTHRPPESP